MSQAGQRDWTSYLAPALRLSRVAEGGNGTAALADCATGWSRRRGARSARLAAAAGGPPGGLVRLGFTTPPHGRDLLLWFTSQPADPASTFQARPACNVRAE